MKTYKIIINPNHNRIYYNESLNLAEKELQAICENKIDISDLTQISSNNFPLSLEFKANTLNEEDISLISKLSSYFMLFEILDNQTYLPIESKCDNKFSDSLVEILKYNGKTNEQFTRLLVNIASNVSQSIDSNVILFDPMCGKGTTLYEGLIKGYNVVGCEINAKWYQDLQNYILRYLKEGKYKHKATKTKQSFKGKKLADIFRLNLSDNKQDYLDKKYQTLEVFNADTYNSNKLIKKDSVDMLICDLPYGVQHGAKNNKGVKVDRSPYFLVKNSMRSWLDILKKSASLVFSFNELTIKYNDFKNMLEEFDLEVLDRYPYNSFIHKVDNSINRNVIVAIKK